MSDNKPQVLVCQGLPASGKSTFSRKWVEEAPKKRVRVCRDDIRRMLGPYWIPTREKLVTSIENTIIQDAVISGYSVIVDATNFKGVHRFLDLIPSDEAEVKLVDHFLNVPLKTCIQRDQQRDQMVGKEVIIRMYNKYLDGQQINNS